MSWSHAETALDPALDARLPALDVLHEVVLFYWSTQRLLSVRLLDLKVRPSVHCCQSFSSKNFLSLLLQLPVLPDYSSSLPDQDNKKRDHDRRKFQHICDVPRACAQIWRRFLIRLRRLPTATSPSNPSVKYAIEKVGSAVLQMQDSRVRFSPGGDLCRGVPYYLSMQHCHSLQG